MPLRRRWITVDERMHRIELGGQGEGLLFGAVVQVARQAVALFGHGQILESLLGRPQFFKQLLVVATGKLGLAHGVAIDTYHEKSSRVEEDAREARRTTKPQRAAATDQIEQRNPGHPGAVRQDQHGLDAQNEEREVKWIASA